MLGEANVTVADSGALPLLLPLAAAWSRLLAALVARLFVMAVTCASAAGLLAAALLAMADSAFTTDPPVDPDVLMGTDTTDESTASAFVCVLAPTVALPLTTASTPAATVVATELLKALVLKDTAPRTDSAAVCTAGVMLALVDAETTASTPAATVEAAEAEREVVFAVTVPRTDSAWDCTSGERVAFGDAVTTTSTIEAAVLAAALESAVLVARLASTLV